MGLGGQALTPRVSVIVPVRDRRALLRRTLDALAAQTLADHEVVVVDDASSDGSGDEARADAARGRPVVVVDGGGRGAVAARRTGVAVARAPYLAFTDSDCIPAPGWLAAGVAALDAGADVVQGRTEAERPAGVFERTVWSATDDGLFATCNAFYRRAAYDAAGGFDTTAGDRLGFRPGSRLRDLGFGEDTLLGWGVRRRGTAAWCADALVRHAVFPPDRRALVERAWNAGGFPALVREVPELRSTFLTAHWFLGPPARVALHLAVVGAAARRRRFAAASVATWVAWRAVLVRRQEGGWRRALRALPGDLALDAVTAAALLAGTARTRTVVL